MRVYEKNPSKDILKICVSHCMLCMKKQQRRKRAQKWVRNGSGWLLCPGHVKGPVVRNLRPNPENVFFHVLLCSSDPLLIWLPVMLMTRGVEGGDGSRGKDRPRGSRESESLGL